MINQHLKAIHEKYCRGDHITDEELKKLRNAYETFANLALVFSPGFTASGALYAYHGISTIYDNRKRKETNKCQCL